MPFAYALLPSQSKTTYSDKSQVDKNKFFLILYILRTPFIKTFLRFF
jgi:hypothetical protein